jgi:uncharacterized membrane protein
MTRLKDTFVWSWSGLLGGPLLVTVLYGRAWGLLCFAMCLFVEVVFNLGYYVWRRRRGL